LKTIVGGRSKKVSAPPVVKQANELNTSPNKYKSYPQRKRSGSHLPRDQRKRETPEEYRLRHEKLDEEKKKIQSNTKETVSKADKPIRKETKRESPKPSVIQEPWDSSLFKVPVEDGKTRFHDFEMPEEILHAIYDLEFKYCTQVQAETLPRSLMGEDVTAQAQTGTGKTAAFLVTILSHFLKNPIEKKRPHGTPRALILAPTRELVLQIEKDARGLGKYVPCEILSLLGGVDYNKQMRILKHEVCDLLICTPGRLIDFIQKKLVDLGKVEIFIIDEADRMLNMGFIPDVKKIVYNLPQKAKRQTMFFTATMGTDVTRLAESWTRQAFEVSVKPDDVAVDTVEQITYITTVEEKPTLLYNIIMHKNLERVLVFVNRRHEAKKLKETFEQYGISCTLLTGDVEQKQRIRRLEKFREGNVRVLVATDVASRGIHVEAISHVINYNMPQDVEEYVHRIGRTGRAGASGISINFADEDDSHELGKLEEYLGKKIQCSYPEENLLEPIPAKHLVKKHTAPRSGSYSKGNSSGPRRRSSSGGSRGSSNYKK